MQLARSPRPQRLSRAFIIAAVYGLLGLAAVGLGAWRGDTDIYRGPASTHTRLLLSPVIGLVLGLLFVFLSRLATHQFEWARTLHREFHSVVHELSPREIVLLAFASSLGEELFFRGALQPWIGLWATSVIFALLHMRLDRRFVPWTVMSFVMSLVLGYLALRLGDLGAPIMAHFVINFMNLGYIARTELA